MLELLWIQIQNLKQSDWVVCNWYLLCISILEYFCVSLNFLIFMRYNQCPILLKPWVDYEDVLEKAEQVNFEFYYFTSFFLLI